VNLIFVTCLGSSQGQKRNGNIGDIDSGISKECEEVIKNIGVKLHIV